MVELRISKNRIALLDDCDSHIANFFKNGWSFLKGKKKHTGYAARTVYDFNWKRRTVYLHHFVIGFPLNGLQVDHINGDGLDNRRSNLRLVNQRKNQQNHKRHRSGEKKYTGAFFDKRRNRWYSQITINKKRICLGIFKTEEEAGNAYLKKISSL